MCMNIPIDAHVDEKDALRYLGHRGQQLGDELEATFRHVVAQVNTLHAAGTAKQYAVTCVGSFGVQLAGTSLVLPGSHIARHVNNAPHVMLIAVTLGYECERLLRSAACLSGAQGLIADACASSMVENAAEVLTEAIATDVTLQGMRAGKRFSPGYGDFPLAVQHDFIEALGALKTLGIHVTKGDLMVPTKSITAVIPLFGVE